jgi:hypothetical protein
MKWQSGTAACNEIGPSPSLGQTDRERTLRVEIVIAVKVLADARTMPARTVDTDAELVAAARREPREFVAL